MHQRRSRSFHSSLKRPSLGRVKMSQTIGTVAEREPLDESLSPDSNKADDSGFTEIDSSAGNSTKYAIVGI